MKQYLLLAFGLLSFATAGAQDMSDYSAPCLSLSDSAEFRRSFLKIFNSRTKKFQTLKKPGEQLENSFALAVSLPGYPMEKVERSIAYETDVWVYSARYQIEEEEEKDARACHAVLLALIRHALKPYVMQERTEVSGNWETQYFFQVERDFYYDSYLEARLEKGGGKKDWSSVLEIVERPKRELYFTGKGLVLKDEDCRRFLRKSELAPFSSFIKLKGKKGKDGSFALNDSMPNYRGRMYEEDGRTVVELSSGFNTGDSSRALAFFNELVARIKYGLPEGYAYYRHHAPASFGAVEMIIFQKAFEEVHHFPAYPRLAYYLTRDPQKTDAYFVWLYMNRFPAEEAR